MAKLDTELVPELGALDVVEVASVVGTDRVGLTDVATTDVLTVDVTMDGLADVVTTDEEAAAKIIRRHPVENLDWHTSSRDTLRVVWVLGSTNIARNTTHATRPIDSAT